MTPFFVSLPRTRSSILFETMRPFVESRLGTSLHMHTEMFLHWGRTFQCVNSGTGESFNTELLPFRTPNGLSMHFVHPPVFQENYGRNKFKLEMLKDERRHGREYFIKGTATMFDGHQEIFDFFGDRLFVFTNRKNNFDMMLSLMVAWETKIFHARPKNIEAYKTKLASVTLSEESLALGDKFIVGIERFRIMREYITKRFSYIDIDYDELETANQRATIITTMLNTDKWMTTIPDKDKLPLFVNKQYHTLITNMDEVYARFGSLQES